MAGRMNMVMLMIMVVASMQLQASMAQTRHTVGDSNGWNVPSTSSAYSTWASTQTFTAGDSLVFTFVTGAHNVAEVTQSAYDACNGTSPISLTGNGPATINLPAAGTRYFICTVGSHCSLGQKVAINVSAVTRRGLINPRVIFGAFGKNKNKNKSPLQKVNPRVIFGAFGKNKNKNKSPLQKVKWLDPPQAATTTSPPAAQPSAPPSSTPAPVSPPPSATTPTSTPAPTEAPASPPVSTPTAAPVSPPVSTPAPAPSPIVYACEFC